VSLLAEQVGNHGYLVDLTGDLGFMITKRHEVGPSLTFRHRGGGELRDFSSGSAGVFYRFNIPTPARELLPFLGARGRWFFGDSNDAGIEYRFETGLRVMPSKRASVNLMLFYRKRTGGNCGDSLLYRSGGGYCDTVGRLGIAVGVSVFF
jgi:hypothetical protein